MIEVRGHSAYNEPATPGVLLSALATDLAWMLALFAFVLHLRGASPVPTAGTTALFIFAFISVFSAFFGAFRFTPGFAIWRLRLLDANRAQLRFWRRGAWIAQVRHLNGNARATAVLLTVLVLSVSSVILNEHFFKHPLLLAAGTWKLQPFNAARSAGAADWAITPYYYSIGAWPKAFGGRPVLYSLPYEKGPPTHFVGHITARWEMPETRVTFEGPHSPDGDRFVDDEMSITHACLTAPWGGFPGGVMNCLRLREKALFRHIREISRIGATDWTMRWFEVENPELPETERPRGIFISGSNATRAQDRFIVINGKGAHQTFILDRPIGARGDLARMMFEQAIRSQRVSTELNTGRAWVDRKLASTQLDKLPPQKPGSEPSQAFIERISEIHTLLLAKISVDPKTYEAYFHLGGTALMLARYGSLHGNTDFTAIAKPLVQSALRYAKDVAPLDRRTAELEGIWQDARKF